MQGGGGGGGRLLFFFLRPRFNGGSFRLNFRCANLKVLDLREGILLSASVAGSLHYKVVLRAGHQRGSVSVVRTHYRQPNLGHAFLVCLSASIGCSRDLPSRSRRIARPMAQSEQENGNLGDHYGRPALGTHAVGPAAKIRVQYRGPSPLLLQVIGSGALCVLAVLHCRLWHGTREVPRYVTPHPPKGFHLRPLFRLFLHQVASTQYIQVW